MADPARVQSCNFCKKTAAQLPPGETFKQCVRCQSTQNLQVIYCSKECQRKDWTIGVPTHKSLCGKPLPQHTTFPDPDPGFTRSKYLEEQIRKLKEDPSLSYVLNRPEHPEDVAISFPEPSESKRFEELKIQAFRNGDMDAVVVMWYTLIPIAAQYGVTLNQLADQLSLEYSIPKGFLRQYSRNTAAQRLKDSMDKEGAKF